MSAAGRAGVRSRSVKRYSIAGHLIQLAVVMVLLFENVRQMIRGDLVGAASVQESKFD